MLHPTMAELWFVSRKAAAQGITRTSGLHSCPVIWARCAFISQPSVETFDVPGGVKCCGRVIDVCFMLVRGWWDDGGVGKYG